MLESVVPNFYRFLGTIRTVRRFQRAAAFRPQARLSILAMVAVALSQFSCNTLAVNDVYASLDQDGRRRRTEFRTDAEAIFCVAEISSGRDNATIELVVRQAKGGGNAPEGTILARGEERSSPGQNNQPIAFLVPRDTGATGQTTITPGQGDATTTTPGYIAGRYACEVYLEGGINPKNGQLGEPNARVEYNVLAAARPVPAPTK
jgi:hypothetical protein